MKKITVLLLTLLLTINLSACIPSRGADFEDIEDIVLEMGYNEVLFVTRTNLYFYINYTDDFIYEDIQPMDSSAVYVAFALKDNIEYMIIYPNNPDYPILEVEQDVLPYEVLLYVQENLEDIITEAGYELLSVNNDLLTMLTKGNLLSEFNIGFSNEEVYLIFEFGEASDGYINVLENDHGEYVLVLWNANVEIQEYTIIKVFTIDDIE